LRKKITYLLLTFPKLTTTFVDREILALRESGTDVQIYALHRPKGPLSEYQKPLLDETHYVYPASLLHRIKAQLYYAFRHPRRYFGTLAYLLTRSHPTFLSHRRTFRHFLQGIFVTYLLHKDPGDHIHAHFLNQSATIALIIQRMLNVPYSVTVHASGEFFATPMMIREKLAEAKFIATCTKYNRDHLEEVGKDLFDGKVLVNYHGLDVDKYQRNKPKPVSPPMILSVGQLRERKGQIYLVQACGILKKRGLDFRCRIIGEGPEREAMEREIEQLDLSGKVTLAGSLPQEQVIHEYESASLFVLPTVLSESGDRDGIPNVILEAMAMELPVISTWNSAIPEVVMDGKNGLLVPPKDVIALADALEKVLTDPPFADNLASEGCRTVREQFDPQRNIQVLVKAFSG
jgi:glycosyltransferase involved in cell wall biosynthesis